MRREERGRKASGNGEVWEGEGKGRETMVISESANRSSSTTHHHRYSPTSVHSAATPARTIPATTTTVSSKQFSTLEISSQKSSPSSYSSSSRRGLFSMTIPLQEEEAESKNSKSKSGGVNNNDNDGNSPPAISKSKSSAGGASQQGTSNSKNPSSTSSSSSAPHSIQYSQQQQGDGPEFTPTHKSSPTLLSGGGEVEQIAAASSGATTTQHHQPPPMMGPPFDGLSQHTTGVIKLTIPNLSTLRQKVTTSFHQIANLPWRLAAKTECTKRTSNVKFFSVYIDCNPESESTLWSCEALVEFRLLSQQQPQPQQQEQQPSNGESGSGGGGDFSRQFTNKFSYNSNNWGFPSFMEWAEITNPERGFMRTDKVLLEAHITVQKVVGVRRNPTYDFTQPLACISDGVVIIDGQQLHINKAYLALHSPVFHAMFFSRFSESSMAEIRIEDVLIDEFVELLSVIYPSRKSVSQENVEYLLELADKFQIQYVVDKCEKFLVKNAEIPLVTKLVWADQYCLARLQDMCVQELKGAGDVKALKQTEEYRQLSDTTKAALLEKLLKILP